MYSKRKGLVSLGRNVRGLQYKSDGNKFRDARDRRFLFLFMASKKRKGFGNSENGGEEF